MTKLTRQQNIEVNTRDILVRIFLRSHPNIALNRWVLNQPCSPVKHMREINLQDVIKIESTSKAVNDKTL